MTEGIDSATFQMPSLDQDQISINSDVTDDEQSLLQISTSSGRPVTRTSTPTKRSSSPFRRLQIGRSSRRSGIVVIKSKRNVAKQFKKEADGDSNDEENSGSENDSQLQKSSERQDESERLSVQDIIHYFESRTETSNSTSKDIESDMRRRSTIVSPEKSASRRWSGVSSGSSPISASERITLSAEGCSSTSECIPDYDPQSIREAHGMDTSGDNFQLERDKQKFDEHSSALSDDAIFPSRESWSPVQSRTITGGAFCDFDDDAPQNSHMERKSMPVDNVAPGYEPGLKMEQYLLAYDNKLRLKSEMMRLPASDIRNNAESFRDLVKSETEILDEMNGVVNHKKVAGDDSFVMAERRGVSDPVLQAHVYVTKDVDKIMSQWYNLRNADQSASSDSFILPARSASNELTDNSWKMNLNNETIDSTIRNPTNALSYVRKEQKDGKLSTCYDDLLMLSGRIFKKDTRSDTLDCDVKLMNSMNYDKEQSTGQHDYSGEEMSLRKKFGLVGLKDAAKASDLGSLLKDLEKTKSRLPVRSVKSSNKGGEVTSRAGSLVSKSSNPLNTREEKEENRKRVEDMIRLRRSDAISAMQRDSLIPTKSAHPLVRASSFQLPSAKPKIPAKPSPSSSLNAGKVGPYRGNISSDSARSSAMESNHTRNTAIRKSAPTVVNSKTAAEKPRISPNPCLLQVRKENDKHLLGRNKPTTVRQQNVPTQLMRKPQQKSAKLPTQASLVEANTRIPHPSMKLSSSTVSTDTIRHGLTKGKL